MKGEGWAYDDVDYKEPFLLHWSSSKGGSASTSNVGDIIVLFQKPNKINGKKNYDVHLTHLVTPISEEVIIDENNPLHKYCRKVKLVAMANPIYAIPNNQNFNFFKPNRGLTNPIVNLDSRNGLTEIEIKEQLWNLFSEHICEGIKVEDYKPENSEGIYGKSEGDKIVRAHIQQEITIRNSRIVQKAKKRALKKGKGKIKCDCCNFDFIETYGELGYGFIECHHKIFLSKGQRITNIDDLALVCSNCHRMLHRKNELGEYNEVEELKNLIEEKKPAGSKA
ncbi:MAG: HNH endonuclease [Saprospiraceae bacterium]